MCIRDRKKRPSGSNIADFYGRGESDSDEEETAFNMDSYSKGVLLSQAAEVGTHTEDGQLRPQVRFANVYIVLYSPFRERRLCSCCSCSCSCSWSCCCSYVCDHPPKHRSTILQIAYPGITSPVPVLLINLSLHVLEVYTENNIYMLSLIHI